MDSVTQGLLGAAIAEAGFRKKLGPKAVLFGAGCAVLPDLDVVVGVFGDWVSLTHHRGATHSLVVLAALAPGFAWLGWRWARKETPYLAWLHLSLWALLTHTLLDSCTTYGTPLLWPFTWHRYAIDAVSIIDPAYTIPLLAAAVLACLKRLPREFSRWFAVGALALTTSYLILGLGLGARARSLARRGLAREGFEPVALRATPALFNMVAWHLVARDAAGDIMVGPVSVWAPKPISLRLVETPDDPLVEKALVSARGRTFVWFSDGYYSASVERHRDGATVQLLDHRYGFVTNPALSPFAARADFDMDGELVDIRLVRHVQGLDLGREFWALWHFMWAGELPGEQGEGN